MKALLRILPVATLLTVGFTAYAAKLKVNPQQIEENTRLQIYLDNANFGPGKIDGKREEFTQKALALFNRSKGQSEAVSPDLSSVDPVYISYTITKEDADNVGPLPTGPVAQAKVKRLPYASVLEAVAERFHCSLGFLKELNTKKRAKSKVQARNAWSDRILRIEKRNRFISAPLPPISVKPTLAFQHS